jgi:hypothetical protein
MAEVDAGGADPGRGRGLAWLIRSRLAQAAPVMRGWRAWVIWGLQTLLAALLLVLLWQPAITVAELKPQQNIIAVLVDDSRSMAISEDGSTRQAQAVQGASERRPRQPQPLFSNASLPRRRRARPHRQPQGPATQRALDPHRRQPQAVERGDFRPAHRRRGAAQRRRRQRRGHCADAISALRARHIPVHTVGFGRERAAHDVELDDAVVAPRALADSRLAAKITLHQRGYAGAKINLTVRDVSTAKPRCWLPAPSPWGRTATSRPRL